MKVKINSAGLVKFGTVFSTEFFTFKLGTEEQIWKKIKCEDGADVARDINAVRIDLDDAGYFDDETLVQRISIISIEAVAI